MIKEIVVFDCKNYKKYLLEKLGLKTKRTGLKSKLAMAISVQPGFISQVLNGQAHFSLEQAQALNDFFNHTPEESHYFLLLVQKDRAGTMKLKKYFEEQLSAIITKRLNLVQRLGTKDVLAALDQATYYSSWHYAAIHVATTIPPLQSISSLSEFFQLPAKKVKAVIDFLMEVGLVALENGRYLPGKTHVRLGNDSVHILRHHTNFRQMALESLDREQNTDLHYSSVVSLSKSDVAKIKDLMLKAIATNLDLIRTSKEEVLYGLNMDFFSFQRSQ